MPIRDPRVGISPVISGSGPDIHSNCTLRDSPLAEENQKGLNPRKAGEERGDQTQAKVMTVSMGSRQ